MGKAINLQDNKVGEGSQPPLHPNCRTSRVPYIEGLDFLDKGATRASEFGSTRKEQYYEWLKRQSPDYQDEILGKGRGKLFRSKGMTAERFRRLQLDKRFREVKLKDLKRQHFNKLSEAKIHIVKGGRDEKEVARLLVDKLDGKEKLSEAISATDYQKAKGIKIKRIDPIFDEDYRPKARGDFITEDGKAIDVMFATGGETEYKRRKFNEFFSHNENEWERKTERIRDHLTKSDIVLMDIRHLTKANKDKLLDYVVSLSRNDQRKIEILDGE